MTGTTSANLLKDKYSNWLSMLLICGPMPPTILEFPPVGLFINI